VGVGGGARRLDSYGGWADGWGVVEPVVGVDALADRLAAARRRGEAVTLRGAGLSFHDQAQGPVVLAVDGLGGPPEVVGDDLAAGASTRLGPLFDAALGAGRVIPVLVTSAHITLGGALATDGVSRASARYGRVSDGVLELTLLTPDGARRVVRRPGPGVPDDERELFRAVVGGFGAIGVVVDVRQRLLRSPWPGAPRVETAGRAVAGPAEVVGPLLAALRAGGQDGPWRGHADPTLPTPWAITHDEGRAIVFEQRLVAPDTPLARFSLHAPDAWGHWLGQWATSVDLTAARVPGLLHRLIQWRGAPFVDPLPDATFMMDGNRAAQRFARRLGAPMGVVQQSYVLPVGPGVDDAGPTLRFVEAAFRRLRDAAVPATVIDLLAMPADASLLSAGGGAPGVVVSVAVQHLGGGRAARGAAVLTRLSEDALALGGRVHLVKHVLASPEVLGAMYGDALRAFAAVRDRYDPERVLSSRLLDRLMGAGSAGR
jgi:decaprenylphospho-beta-D-ribofuranose 2-oxidase